MPRSMACSAMRALASLVTPMKQQCVALLGRRDEPTDAVEEYCRYLAAALLQHDLQLDVERVPWKQLGWHRALADLRKRARKWHGAWVFVQYSALAWSERGFPPRFLRVLKTLQKSGAHVAVVFHDVEPYAGARIIDRLRRSSQLRTMRAAVGRLRIFTVPPDHLSWKPTHKFPLAFIPVGANFSDAQSSQMEEKPSASEPLTVAVFGITGGAAGNREVADIARSVRDAALAVGSVRLVVFGRNSDVFADQLREGLRGANVDLHLLGVLPAEGVARVLRQADVLLFVRGAISTRRGSAIAGIACGLPVVAFTGFETAEPVTLAGLEVYSPHQPQDLSRALLRVLQDPVHRSELAARSQAAQDRYFSWAAIARRYVEELHRVEPKNS